MYIRNEQTKTWVQEPFFAPECPLHRWLINQTQTGFCVWVVSLFLEQVRRDRDFLWAGSDFDFTGSILNCKRKVQTWTSTLNGDLRAGSTRVISGHSSTEKTHAWCCRPMFSVHGTLRQEDVCEFRASMGDIMSSRPSWTSQPDPISENKKIFLLDFLNVFYFLWLVQCYAMKPTVSHMLANTLPLSCSPHRRSDSGFVWSQIFWDLSLNQVQGIEAGPLHWAPSQAIVLFYLETGSC